MSAPGGDHTAYVAFLRRVLRALARRVGDADPEDLAEMVALRGEVDEAIRGAVLGMRSRGVSWSDIGRAVTYLPLLYRTDYGTVVLRRAGDTSPREAEMTTYQLTDKITDATVIVAGHDVEEALREWNPEAPDDVLQACTDLGAAVMAGTYTGDLEALLQVEVMQIA